MFMMVFVFFVEGLWGWIDMEDCDMGVGLVKVS